jgi:hypothetical protein
MSRTRSDEPVASTQSRTRWIASEWPRFLDPPVEKSRTPLVVLLCVAVGLCFDLAMRSGVRGVGGALCIALASAALLVSNRVRNPQAMILIGAAPIFGVWLIVRATPWLLVPDVLAACALVLLGVSLSAGAPLFDLSIARVIARALQAGTQALLSPVYLLAGVSRDRRWLAGVVRGAVIATPILLVLGVLLASADAVFASIIRFDLNDVIGHIVLVTFGILAAAALFRIASLENTEVPATHGPRLGTAEWTVVLAALNLLLGAFAVARLIALSEGGQRVLASAGLTYSEYARTGFFQLLAAAALAVGVIAALHATADRPTATLRAVYTGLSLGVVGLTLALVVSAFHRLVLYESAFGLTMLRIYAQTAIVWVGIVLVLLGAWIAGVGRERVWVWSAAGIAALVLLFGLNAIDPESLVARHNIAHQARTNQTDTGYLYELSIDAAPTIAKSEDLRGYVCANRAQNGFRGWAAYNVAVARADKIRTAYCGESKGVRP